MTRAQTLGLMAAQLAAGSVVNITVSTSEGGRQNGVHLSPNVEGYVSLADALLREAERVSPEPENPGPTLTYTYDPSSPHPHIWGSAPGYVSEPNT